MKYFSLTYDAVENYAERRTPFREEHLKLVREAFGRGEIVMAGALGDPPDGTLFVFRVGDCSVVERFARNDPYVTNGLITNWRVRPWNVVVGGDV
jgi:uncharacterized protein YciI